MFNTAKPATTGFGGFGSPTASFGNTSNTNMFSNTAAANTTSSGFGSMGGGFGAKPATTTFGGFGSTPAPSGFGNAPATSGFGSAPATGFGNTGGFGFGASTGGFGAPAATPSFGNAFGGGFGNAAAAPVAQPQNTFSSMFSQPLTNQQTQQQQVQLINPIIQAFERIESAYNPVTKQNQRNEECRFKAVVYNKRTMYNSNNSNIDANTIIDPLLTNPLVEQAERDNFDPEEYVVVEELGVQAMKARFEKQNEEVSKASQQVEKLVQVIQSSQENNHNLAAKFELLKMRQQTLHQKLLASMRKLEVLRCHGTPLQLSEIKFRDRLKADLERLEAPYKRLQEISVIMALQDNQQLDHFEEDVKEEDIQVLVGALRKQSEGLENLAEVLRKDLRDINIINQYMHHKPTTTTSSNMMYTN